MSVLLCTSKYRAVFGLPDRLLEPPGENNGLLGPWYANTLSVAQQRLLHFMSSRTLLPIVIWLREKSTAEERMRSTLGELLHFIGAPADVIAAELEALDAIWYARASDRSRLASMRDQTITAKHAVRGGRAQTPWDLTLDLARMPAGVFGYKTPIEETAQLLQARFVRPRR